MAEPADLHKLEIELEKIKWDIVGLCEVRRPGEEVTILQSGHVLYHREGTILGQGGMGFMVNRKLKSRITEVNSLSDRVIYIKLKLSNMYELKIIQVHSPTTDHSDEEVENFYDDISNILDNIKTRYTLLMGDFNGRVGMKLSDTEISIGQYGLGIRNKRGQTLLDFLQQRRLYAMNTFFSKKPQHKWTWKHPNGRNKNEYDYIITDRKCVISDVSVLNKFDTGSDHRLVRAECYFDVRKDRRNLITKRPTPNHVKIEIIRHNQDYIKERLDSSLNADEMVEHSVDDMCQRLVECLNTTLSSVTPVNVQASTQKLTADTLRLIEKRRQMNSDVNADQKELSQLHKEIRNKIRKDLQEHNEKIIQDALERNKSRRSLKLQLSTGRKAIFKLQREDGTVTSNRDELLNIAHRYYENLYKSKVTNPAIAVEQHSSRRPPVLNVGSEDLPDVTPDEVCLALRQLKNRKAPGEDGIIPEILKTPSKKLQLALAMLFTKCLIETKVPEDWNNAVITLLHKKGDIKKLDNYRPISLLSHVYKLFTRVIVNRLKNKLDSYQPREQAGFRSGYSTCDHLQAVKTLIEKCHEYQKPIMVTFVDYEKAFDSVEAWAVENSLVESRVDERYIKMVKYLQENATACVNLHEKTRKFKLARGVRQGDTISPKLFTATLEGVFKKLNWEEKGIEIEGERLTNLRFADDLVLFSDNVPGMLSMIQDLKTESGKVGLKMNISKTKIMTNIPGVDSYHMPVELVTSYIYLGHKITLGLGNQTAEVERRISQAWAAFGANNQILRNKKLSIKLKAKVFEECITPVFTYGAETMTLTERSAEKLRVAQRAMERAMLGITLRDRRRNEWIRRKTGLKDVVEVITGRKWRWAGHIARMDCHRWTRRLVVWRPWADRRPRGRPPLRWVDDIRKHAGHNWMARAADRESWRKIGEAYVQKWTTKG